MNEQEKRRQDKADQDRARKLRLENAGKICRCCPECSDFPCDGALDENQCEHVICVCSSEVA